jgi:hypothetical protein
MADLRHARIERLHKAFLDGAESCPDLQIALVSPWPDSLEYQEWPIVARKDGQDRENHVGIPDDLLKKLLNRPFDTILFPLHTLYLWIDDQLWQGCFYTEAQWVNPTSDDPDSLRRQYGLLVKGIEKFHFHAREAVSQFEITEICSQHELLQNVPAHRWLEVVCQPLVRRKADDDGGDYRLHIIPGSIFNASAKAVERLEAGETSEPDLRGTIEPAELKPAKMADASIVGDDLEKAFESQSHRNIPSCVDPTTRSRPCQSRNALFLKWHREIGSSSANVFGQIRDRWNGLPDAERKPHSPCDNRLPTGKGGYDTVRKAIEAAEANGGIL